MKLQGSKKVHYDSGPNMTPLVDVVMVILIFLMLAGTLGGTEHYLISDVPPSKVGPLDPTDKRLPEPDFQIYIDPTGPGSAQYAPAGQEATTDPDKLSAELVTVRDQLGRAKADDKGHMVDSTTRIVLVPRDDVQYQPLIDCYEAALNAGFTKIGFNSAKQ